MLIFDEKMLAAYQEQDSLLAKLQQAPEDCLRFTSHRWLLDSLPKRMIYWHTYGDLLATGQEPKKILDIGGGFSSLSKTLIKNQHYQLLDLLAHDDGELLQQQEHALDKAFLIAKDWLAFEPQENYDIIIANDIFPNVDQRLELFLEKYLPHTQEIRLTLTYYNTSKWYKVKRCDADEIYHVLAWDGKTLRRVLEKYQHLIEEANLENLKTTQGPLFTNGRDVCFVRIRRR